MSVEWEEEAIFLRLGPELQLVVDRTPHLPRHMMPMGLQPRWLHCFSFRMITKSFYEDKMKVILCAGGDWKQRPLSTRIYKYFCFFNLLQTNTNVDFVGDGIFGLDWKLLRYIYLAKKIFDWRWGRSWCLHCCDIVFALPIRDFPVRVQHMSEDSKRSDRTISRVIILDSVGIRIRNSG